MSNARSVAEHRLNLTILDQRSRSWRIAFTLLLCLAGWYYYATIDGSFRRPSTAAFTPPSFLANEVTRPIGASWQAVSVTSNDPTVLRGWLFRPSVWNGRAVCSCTKRAARVLTCEATFPGCCAADLRASLLTAGGTARAAESWLPRDCWKARMSSGGSVF